MRLFPVLVLFLCCAAPALGQPSPHIAATDPRPPAEQAKLLRVPAGFEVQLVAAEPDIVNPINIAFDARGRLWVTQSIEYPFPAEDAQKARDTVKVLEDFGPDGRARKITTFADKLNIPIGVLPTADGALVYSIPSIWHMIDRDGDGKADERKVLYTGYGYKDTHGMTGEFMWGFDGWVYCCHGFSNASTVKGSGPEQITMQSGNTYRIKADGSRIEYFTHGQVNPFGLAFDPLGNLYSCDCHSRPLYQLLRGAWYPSFGKPNDGLGFGPEMITHSHGSTAIAGIAYYGDDRFPAEYRDNLFIGNVVTNRINRDRLERIGATYKGIEMPDFVRSDDPWFRPVDIKLGPDGALYVADFYDRIIGHYEVPLNHPGRDRTHGRIWRIVYRGADGKQGPRLVRDLSRAMLDELASELNHPNIGVRIHATNRLVERGKESAGTLRTVLDNGTALQRVHALWGLARLDALDDKALSAAAEDQDAPVRVHAMRVLSERPTLSKAEHDAALAGLKDADAFVRRAAADALGRHPNLSNVEPLLAIRHAVPAGDTHLLHVVRMALRDQLQDATLLSLMNSALGEKDSRALADACLGVRTPESADFLMKHLERFSGSNPLDSYAHHIARYGNAGSGSKLLALTEKIYANDLPAQATVFRAVPKALQERGAKMGSADQAFAEGLVGKLMHSKNAAEVQSGIELAGELRIAAVQPELKEFAGSKIVAENQRKAACTSLAQLDPEAHCEMLAQVMLASSESLPLREHVARTLAQTNRATAQAKLVKALELVPARLQTVVAEGLAESKGGAQLLLDAIAKGKASARLLQNREVEVRLQRSQIPDLKAQLANLTRGLPPADAAMQQLLARRQAGASAAAADIKKGQLVFEKTCAACHQLQNKGNKIGPQLDGIGIRGPERLLEDLLDPNRNVDQEFRATTLSLKNGQLVVGLLLKQEGEVLVLADGQGKEMRVPANDVETRLVSQLSPMPANLSEQIPEEDFYHLLRYLLSQRPVGN